MRNFSLQMSEVPLSGAQSGELAPVCGAATPGTHQTASAGPAGAHQRGRSIKRIAAHTTAMEALQGAGSAASVGAAEPPSSAPGTEDLP